MNDTSIRYLEMLQFLPIYPAKRSLPEIQDHLKAYGIAFYALKENINVDWLLNYKGGSFLINNHKEIIDECILRGVRKEDGYIYKILKK